MSNLALDVAIILFVPALAAGGDQSLVVNGLDYLWFHPSDCDRHSGSA